MEIRVAANPVWSEAFLREMIATWTTIPLAKLMDAGKVDLMQAAPDPLSPKSDIADFVAGVADFEDYTQKTLALLVPVNLGQDVEGGTQTFTWTITSDPVLSPNSIVGYYLTAVSGALACYEVFDVPVQMAEYADSLVLVLQLPLQSYQTPTGLPA